jgi:hypothetical protein
MWKRNLTHMLIALTALALSAGNAAAIELSMICENPGRTYVAYFDRDANSFRIETAEEITHYQVREIVDIDAGFIVRGTTVDEGPDFAAYISVDPRIEFLVGGEIIQTDYCLSTGSPNHSG